MKNNMRIFDTPMGQLVFESGPDAFKTTHRCACCFTNKHHLCAGIDPCGIHCPEHEGKTIQERCSLGFFVKFDPVIE
jgi:coenzyme F420-reducing hydrogenase gamma subunit